jgi:hypothetical protein
MHCVNSGGIFYVKKLIIINLLSVYNEFCVYLITGCAVYAVLCIVYFVFVFLCVCMIPLNVTCVECIIMCEYTLEFCVCVRERERERAWVCVCVHIMACLRLIDTSQCSYTTCTKTHLFIIVHNL